MRIIVTLCLFLFLTRFTTTHGDPDDDEDQDSEPSNSINYSNSNLKLIASDFRILSRVINAIYLQAAALQKDIKINQVLMELLQIDPNVLKKSVMDVDVESAKKELDRLDGEFQKQRKNADVKSALFNDLSVANLKLTLSYMNFIRHLRQPTTAELLQKSKNLSSVEFLQEAAKLQNDPVFDTSCARINDSALSIVVQLFGPLGEIHRLDGSETKTIIEEFGKLSDSVFECLDDLEGLSEDMSNLDVRSKIYGFQMVKAARKLSTKYVVFNKSMKNITDIILRRLRAGFNATKPFWDSEPSEAIALSKLMTNVYESVKEIHEYNEDYTETEYVHTAGFANSSDLIKVYDDLKSPWFLQKIARGANITNLMKVFTPFRTVSEKIISLETAWVELTELAEKKINEDTIDGLQVIAVLKAFAFEYSERMNRVDAAMKKLESCQQNTYLKYAKQSFETIEKQESVAENILDKMKEIESQIIELMDSMNTPIVDTDMNRYQNSKNIFMAINDTYYHYYLEENDTALATERVKEIVGAFDEADSEVSFILFEKVVQLTRNLKKLKEYSKRIDVDNLIPVGSMVDDLKIIEESNCIRDSFTEQDFNLVRHAVQMFIKLREFKSRKVVKQTKDYLEKLVNVQLNLQDVTKTVDVLRSKVIANASYKSLLSLNNSRVFTENIGLCTQVLENMNMALEYRTTLENLPDDFSHEIYDEILELGLIEWIHASEKIPEMIENIEETDVVAGEVRNLPLIQMARVFEQAAQVKGIVGSKENLRKLYYKLISQYSTKENSATKRFGVIRKLDLDFAKHHSRLLNAKITIQNVQKFFDDLFGHTPQHSRIITIEKVIKPPISWQVIVGLCIGFIFILGIIMLVIYGLTEKGRAHYKNLYIYYFGKHEDFEKRWRYSLFMDTFEEKNVILDAVREGNKTNLLKALKSGAYIDAYNKLGNTALHVATKFAQAEHVELLIQYGADRNLLNAKNLLPIQMIPYEYEKNFPKKIPEYDRIKKIYKKYEKKSFKICVPQAFPVSSFHIWPDDLVDENLADQFAEKFKAITSDEPVITTTHVVLKTDKDGVLDTDRLDALQWIFHGSILVKEQWMTDCLNDEKLIKRDMDYLIEKVKYKGKVYETVIEWTETMSKGKMPFLLGVFVAVVTHNLKNMYALSTIVTSQGGTFLNVFPTKEHFNVNSRPYLHANLGPLFLIHDGTTDLSQFKNDPDRMYTLFTEEEFMTFLLKKEINRDLRINPPPVLKREDD